MRIWAQPEGGSVQRASHPHEAGREPALAVQDPPPPPLLIGGVHYFDDVAGLETQLLVIHGDMIPKGLCTHAAIADQLGGGRGL